MNGGEVLVATLRSRGVDTAFFVAGGTFITVMEALSREANAIRGVPVRLESSATFAAEAYASMARKPAAVFVTRAPGASNAAIGVHNAMQSSRPMVLFVAGIPGPLKGREAFQEIDYNLMYRPIAKAVLEVHSFDEIARITARALDLSVSGRPGPVVVSVGRDVLDGPEREVTIPAPSAPVVSAASERDLDALAAKLDGATHPLILAGEMIAYEGAHTALERLADASGAGVVVAYRQQDVLRNDHPGFVGHLTLNRLAHVERALDQCDLLLVVGSRLDSVTSNDYTFLRDRQELVMVHPDPGVFSQWQPSLALASASEAVLSGLSERVEAPPAARVAWRDALHAEESGFRDATGVQVYGAVNMAQVLAHFREAVPGDSIMVSDAGTFGRWLHRFYAFNQPDTCLGPVSGAMGYGVPGGIGACIGGGGRPVFTFVGDGGFLMTGQEAAAVVQERLPLKIIVCDNQAWGSIVISAEKRFPGMEYGTRLVSPDFETLGRGYGMTAVSVRSTAEFAPALDTVLATDGPALMHIHLDVRDVSPFVG